MAKNKNRGTCDVCGVEVSNIYTHRKSKKHLDNVKRLKDESQTDTHKPQTKADAKNNSPGDKESGEVLPTDSQASNDTAGHDSPGNSKQGDAKTNTMSEGVIVVEDELPEELPDKEPEYTEVKEAKPQEQTITGIQIIGEEPKKESAASWIDKVMEFAFSEEVAPITTALMAGIANKLNGNVNEEQEQGAIVETVGGGKIRVLNKNF